MRGRDTDRFRGNACPQSSRTPHCFSDLLSSAFWDPGRNTEGTARAVGCARQADLWVAHEALSKLPRNIRALQKSGLTLCATDDIGSYKKIIPALDQFPHAFIATADDDMYYAPSWLEGLVAGYGGDLKEIVCRRAHKIILDENGRPLPYLQWKRNTDCRKRSNLLFPTSGGGCSLSARLLP